MDRCSICGDPITDREHDHKPDLSGLDDGPYLPGRAPRKKPPPKTPEKLRAIRARAWATRRALAPKLRPDGTPDCEQRGRL